MTRALVILLLALPLVAAEPQTFEVTAYCNEGPNGCAICCGKWAKLNRTASGHRPTPGVTCAAPRRIPFGTRLWIEGVGVRVVQDRLSPKFDSRIDVFFASHSEARRFGKRTLKVRVMQ
jgi:3D (Asp-Asp-Asp) domain-containing protein